MPDVLSKMLGQNFMVFYLYSSQPKYEDNESLGEFIQIVHTCRQIADNSGSLDVKFRVINLDVDEDQHRINRLIELFGYKDSSSNRILEKKGQPLEIEEVLCKDSMREEDRVNADETESEALKGDFREFKELNHIKSFAKESLIRIVNFKKDKI